MAVDFGWPDLTWLARDVDRQLAARRRARRAARAWAAVSMLLLAAAAVMAAWPYAQRMAGDRLMESQAVRAASRAAAFPYASKSSMVREAVAYNEALAASGQPTLGVSSDPFTGETDGDWDGSDDEAYTDALDVDGVGTMGRVRIPMIGVDLRIGHGSGQDTLAAGAGHLHGTSLPVGGDSTHTVITAHTDWAKATMFDRLTELREGDAFYLEVMGRTLAYRVTDVRVVDPRESEAGGFDMLKVRKGEDLATLLTCTGSGLTRRLLVTGERNRMPDQVPYPQDGPQDGRRPLVAAAMAGRWRAPG